MASIVARSVSFVSILSAAALRGAAAVAANNENTANAVHQAAEQMALNGGALPKIQSISAACAPLLTKKDGKAIKGAELTAAYAIHACMVRITTTAPEAGARGKGPADSARAAIASAYAETVRADFIAHVAAQGAAKKEAAAAKKEAAAPVATVSPTTAEGEDSGAGVLSTASNGSIDHEGRLAAQVQRTKRAVALARRYHKEASKQAAVIAALMAEVAALKASKKRAAKAA